MNPDIYGKPYLWGLGQRKYFSNIIEKKDKYACVQLSNHELDMLKSLAKDRELSRSEYIREIISEFLKKENK